MARDVSNAYFLAMFAACREIDKESKHIGIKKKEDEETKAEGRGNVSV